MKRVLALSVSFFGCLLLMAQTLTPQARQVGEYLDTDVWMDLGDEEYIISSPGASFMKVHFDYFNVPDGYVVEVANLDGTEVYSYGKHDRDSYTFDPEMGEDGYTSFAAMSITGDTAVIRMVQEYASKRLDPNATYGVGVRQYVEGYPEPLLQEILGEPLFAGKKNQPGETESTCGVNERYDVECWSNDYPTEYERSHAVARMLMGGSLCTGWRVGDGNFMFTNEHCMNSASAVSGSEAWFNYQNTACNGNQLAGTVKVAGDQLLDTDYNLDYTLFTVKNFASIESFGNLGLDVRTPSLGEEIYIPQHGSGNPKELAIESDRNSGGLCQIDDAVANGRANNSDTGYYCDTIGGSSGSPVLARSSHKVIALHHFGGCTNQGVRIDLIWPQVAGFFNNQIPQGSGGSTEPPPPPGPSLSVNGYKVKGKHTIDLTWANVDGGSVDIYRNGSFLTTTANDGSYTDATGNKGGNTSYTYEVCEAGTSTCTNTATASF